MKSEKHKELLLEMIVSLSNIDSLDLNLGDSRYLLSNIIAKYTNCGKIFLSEKTKKLLEEASIKTYGEVKYKSKFYGKKSTYYKTHKVQFIVEHVVPCGVILKLILESDKTKKTIEKILDCNKVVMLLKEEDLLLNQSGYSKKTTDDFEVYSNIWGRYSKSGISVSENYFINTGTIFR